MFVAIRFLKTQNSCVFTLLIVKVIFDQNCCWLLRLESTEIFVQVCTDFLRNFSFFDRLFMQVFKFGFHCLLSYSKTVKNVLAQGSLVLAIVFSDLYYILNFQNNFCQNLASRCEQNKPSLNNLTEVFRSKS